MNRLRVAVVLGWMLGACATPEVATKPTEPAVKGTHSQDVKPAEPAAAEVKPAEVKPAETVAAVAKPADTTPVDTKPADAKPADTKPAVAKPADTKPADTKPADAKPADAKPASGKYTLVAGHAPDKKTERTWKSKCASCHGADGKGATEKGKKMKVADMTSAAWQTGQSNAELRKAITDGLKRDKAGVKQEMDGFGAELAADQVEALVQLVRYFGAPK